MCCVLQEPNRFVSPHRLTPWEGREASYIPAPPDPPRDPPPRSGDPQPSPQRIGTGRPRTTGPCAPEGSYAVPGQAVAAGRAEHAGLCLV